PLRPPFFCRTPTPSRPKALAVKSESEASTSPPAKQAGSADPPRAHHIVFLKTHKTGGSTVQNLLFRLGEKERLTFAFPYASFQFFYPTRFQAEFVDELPLASSHFDVLCSHTRLDLEELGKVMPADSVYVTILRDPATTFESLFSYYQNSIPAFSKVSAATGSGNLTALLSAFLEMPEFYYNASSPGNGLAKNPMTFDLGLDNQEWASTWPEMLEQLSHAFQLVMMAEYFDESLILLKDLLGLEHEDLIYVKLNLRQDSYRTPLTEEMLARMQSWNSLDLLLYSYFKEVFWERVRRYGLQRMAREVSILKSLVKETRHLCLQEEALPPGELGEMTRPFQPETAIILGYALQQNLTEDDAYFCLRLVLPELQYHTHLYFQQYKREVPSIED
ncbi:galactose-3-O-sulfotransferase 3, partial [Erpetoichthys calabaricus]|uniref:galactose-3-O-sulfotransferase 3 n=1 Tax=Erpetoichthys calabaricus TaxID=27687 RepID=UPI00109F644C